MILINSGLESKWLLEAVQYRMAEEFDKLQVEVNQEKSKTVDLSKGESFAFLGFIFRRVRSRKGKWRPHYEPQQDKRKKLLGELKETFYKYRAQPISKVIAIINPKLRGYCNYFRIGKSARHFSYMKWWVIVLI